MKKFCSFLSHWKSFLHNYYQGVIVVMKYPFVGQDGLKDCGVCSLLMIMKYYGGRASKEYLRELTNTTKDGVNSYSLLEAANKLNFSTKGVKGSFSDLDDNDLPCIAHVVLDNSYQHFVVIYRIDRKKKQLIIADPATSIKKMAFSEFEAISSGNFLLFYPEKKIPILDNSSHIKSILKLFLFKNYLSLINLILLSFVFTMFGIVLSFQFQLLIDFVISNSSHYNLFIFALIFGILIFMKEWIGLWKNLLLQYLNHLLSDSLIMDIYHHLLSLPYLYYKNRTTGEIVSRIQDLENVKEFIGKIFITCFVDSFLVIFSFMVLINLSSKLTFILTVAVIIMILLIILVWKIIYPYLKKIREKNAIVNSYLVESITGIETIRSFGLENYTFNKFSKKYRNYNNFNYRTSKLYLYLQFIRNFIVQITVFIILVVGGYLVIKNRLAVSTLITYYALVFNFLDPIQNLLDIGFSWKEAKISFGRIEELYQIQEMNCESTGLSKDKINGDIKIESLNYKYSPKRKILSDIDFHINPKDRVLIYGKSGEGKSTLAKIISQVLKADSGNVYLDNYPLSEYNSSTFSKQICYLSQNEFLFNDSLYNNIYLDSQRDYKDFLDICSICMVDEIIDNHPLRYQMLLEENGFNISGGERQRVILARAILKNADVYIFDESLNEIDVDRERIILNNLFNRYPDKTFIVISHRYHNNNLFNRKFEIKGGKCYDVS